MEGSRLLSILFPEPGRADEQHIVAACRRNLQSPFHILLPQHVPEIQFRNTGLFRHPRRLLGQGYLSIQPRCQLAHSLHRNDGGASGKGGLRRVFRRDEEGLYPLPLGGQRHGQHAGYGTNLPVQAHLAQKGTVRPGTADAAAGGKNAQKNRKIIMGARFLPGWPGPDSR